MAAQAHAHTTTQGPPLPVQNPAPTEPHTQSQTCPGQDVATRQTSNGFNSITDGQPGTPLQPQVTAIPSYDFDEDEFQNQFSIQATLVKSGFWCQAQFHLTAPTLVMGETLIDSERSVTLSWQQRWLIDNGGMPTISTIVALQQPYDEPDEETDLVVTGVIVKSISWGALYLNLIAETAAGIAFDNFEYSGVAGVKRIVDDRLAVFADVVIQEQGAYALEFSLERDLKRGWTLGPGVSLQRSGDGSDWPEVSVGVNVVKSLGG